MAGKSKRVQATKGRQQATRQARSPSRAKSETQQQARSAREGNGHQDFEGTEHVEQPHEMVSQFARMAGEQVRQAARQMEWPGTAPQVMGWTSRGPAKQIENMINQFWNLSGNGGSSRYMRALAQANVEMVGLLGRRSRAYLDLPTHLAQCRTPQQMLDEQAKFFQDMMHDYQVTNDRVMNCWMEAAAPLISGESRQRAEER